MNKIVKLSARTAVAAAVLSLGGAAFAATFDANIEQDNSGCRSVRPKVT